MVSTVAMALQRQKLCSGFGMKRTRRTCGRGIIRNIASAGTRALGNFLVNKLANVIAGSGKRRTVRKTAVRRTVTGSSWKPSGYGMRKPRKTLTRKRRTATGGARKVARKPRKTLTLRRRVRRVLF